MMTDNKRTVTPYQLRIGDIFQQYEGKPEMVKSIEVLRIKESTHPKDVGQERLRIILDRCYPEREHSLEFVTGAKPEFELLYRGVESAALFEAASAHKMTWKDYLGYQKGWGNPPRLVVRGDEAPYAEVAAMQQHIDALENKIDKLLDKVRTLSANFTRHIASENEQDGEL